MVDTYYLMVIETEKTYETIIKVKSGVEEKIEDLLGKYKFTLLEKEAGQLFYDFNINGKKYLLVGLQASHKGNLKIYKQPKDVEVYIMQVSKEQAINLKPMLAKKERA